jgi:hypothetical protein
MADAHYIVDLRPEWSGNPCITLWRPKNAGYAYAVEWAGHYTFAEIHKGGDYYTKTEGGRLIRFGVLAEQVKKLAVPPWRDGIFDRGLVVTCLPNTGEMRTTLRRLAVLRPSRRYVVRVEGYDSREYLAPTASKARAMAFRAWKDAGLPGSFIDFQQRASVLHLGATNAH